MTTETTPGFHAYAETTATETTATETTATETTATETTATVAVTPEDLSAAVSDLAHADLFGSFLVCGTLVGIALLWRFR